MAPLSSEYVARNLRLRRISVGLWYVMNLFKLWRSILRRRRNRRIRRSYVRRINLSRRITSEYSTLVRDFYTFNDSEVHFRYFRMDEERFRDLLNRVSPLLEHAPTHRMPIPPAFRLALTLKVLASGDSVTNTASTYRIGYKTALSIIYETCEALWKVLQPEFLRLPTEREWEGVAADFWRKWNFPLCLGALDGKHVVMKKPPGAGSEYFNYKRDHSIVLLAVADADYCFLYVDIGAFGRSNDSGVFTHSSFGKALSDEANNFLRIPGFQRLPGTRVSCPHVFVGDDAFPMGPHILKPFGGTARNRAQRIFDYRLSRARGVVENSFGILVARWRILQKPLCCDADNAETIVKATVALHNYLRKTDSSAAPVNKYMPPLALDYVDEASGEIRGGAWRHNVPVDPALQQLATHTNKCAFGKRIRDRFKDFFVSDNGSVQWQYRRFPEA